MITIGGQIGIIDGVYVKFGIPTPVTAPVRNGFLYAWIAEEAAGPCTVPKLRRTLIVQDGLIPPLRVFLRDMVPEGWLVVSYAANILATGPVRFLNPSR